MKMKVLVFIIGFLQILFSYSAHAQDQTRKRIDSLKTELQKFDEDTNKVKTMNALSRQYLNSAIYDSVLYYSNAALDLARELNDDFGVMKANINIGNVYLRRSDFPMAQEYYQKSLKIGKKSGDKLGIFSALNNIGLTFSRQSKHSEALKNFLEALKVANEMGDQERIANASANIGMLYFYLSDYTKSMEYFNKGYDIAEQFDNEYLMAATLSNLGLVYFEVSNYQKALECFNKALTINKNIGDQNGRGINLSNIGRLHSELSDYREALESYHKALVIFKESGSKNSLAITLNNIGEANDKLLEYQKAYDYFKESISISEEIGSKASLVPGLNNLGSWYSNTPDSVLWSVGVNPETRYELALQYTERALTESTEAADVFGQKNAWETLSEVYANQEDFQNAYQAHKEFVVLEDSIHGEEVKDEVTRKEVQFEYEKKMVAARAEQEKVVLRQRSYMISGGFAILLLLLLFNQQRLKARKNKALLDKEKEVDLAKTRFFENVSHDFKTPLTLILNPSERLLRRVQDPSDKEELSRIHHNANYLHRLINQLLEMSKHDKRLLEPKPLPGDLDDFVKETVSMFSKTAASRSIELNYQSAIPDSPLQFDPNIVETIVYNLLNNALSYTPEGGRIDVALSLDSNSSGKTMVMRVADTGQGIPAELQDKVFERYFTKGKSENGSNIGTGVGLAIVRELAKATGGSVTLKSRPGEGSEFIVVMPVYTESLSKEVPKVEDPLPKAESAERAAVDSGADKPLVLVVEDNTDMRKMVADGLRTQYQVQEAINGVEALKLAEEHIPDIVVCDIMMPEMDGLTFANKIKENLATSHIPVILLTAKDSKTDREIGLKSGAIAYLTKPFHEPELQALIANQIQLREKSWEHFEQRNGISFKTIDVKSDKIAADLREFIRSNVSNEELNIDEVCKHAGFSRTQLYRKLKGATGKSIGEFIKLVRIEVAAEILSHSELSISEVAYQTGFSTHSHFSKSFAEAFGMSPTEFLNQKVKS